MDEPHNWYIHPYIRQGGGLIVLFGINKAQSGFTIDIRPNGEGIKFCIGSRLAPITGTRLMVTRLLCGMRPKGGHHDRLIRPMEVVSYTA